MQEASIYPNVRSESLAVVSSNNSFTTALEKSRHSASMRAGQLHHVIYQPHPNFMARPGEASISAGLIVKTGYSGFLWFLWFFSVAENIFLS